jgi:hypothetical protein
MLTLLKRVRITLRLTVSRQSVRLDGKPLRLTSSNFIFQLNTSCCSLYVTSSLTRTWVCNLKLLLVLARAALRDSWPHFTVSVSRLPQPGGPGQIRSQSQSYFTTGFLPLRPMRKDFFQLNSCSNSPYVISSLTRRWVLSRVILYFSILLHWGKTYSLVFRL